MELPISNIYKKEGNIVLNELLTTSVTAGEITIKSFFLCTLVSIILGVLGAVIYMYKNNYSKHFVLTLTLLPAMVQMVIILVNGNLGTGVAVMGAFSLVRFRSIPGGAREIGNIFLAMGVGLACGMGYLVIATVFLVIIGVLSIILLNTNFGSPQKTERDLKVLIPENLDYPEIFNDLFEKYTIKNELILAKTTNMGSIYELLYAITLKDISLEKKFIDEIRCRNGNLNIMCGRLKKKEEL